MSEEKQKLEENETKKLTFGQITKESFHKICVTTTAHGIPRIADTDHIVLKIFWSILLFFSTVGAVYCKIIKC